MAPKTKTPTDVDVTERLDVVTVREQILSTLAHQLVFFDLQEN
jgi:hypothetical protein